MSVKYIDTAADAKLDPLAVELRYYCDWHGGSDVVCGKQIEGAEYLHHVTLPANPTVRQLCQDHLAQLFDLIY